jgi:hypothetical protein
VYEKAHRVSEDVTLNTGIEGHEQGYGKPPISQSLQAKDQDRQSSCSPSRALLPTYDKRERERDVRVLDLKGLVGKYLGTQDLDTSQMYSTYHEG